MKENTLEMGSDLFMDQRIFDAEKFDDYLADSELKETTEYKNAQEASFKNDTS